MSLDHDTPAAIDSLLRFSQGASQPFGAYVAEFSTLLEHTNTDVPATLQVVLFLNGLRSVSTRAQVRGAGRPLTRGRGTSERPMRGNWRHLVQVAMAIDEPHH